jgi:hypothetical protein
MSDSFFNNLELSQGETSMAMGKVYAEDIVGGAIVSIVGAGVVAASKNLPSSIEIITSVALVLFGVFFAVKFVTRWVFFLVLSGLREACGLFVEMYIVEKTGSRALVVAPMVVYFDVGADSLSITGHAFKRTTSAQKPFESYAHWQSLAVHNLIHKNEFEIFYLHDGELVGAGPNEVPGTTSCKLPRPTVAHCRHGYFCDLVQVNRSLEGRNGGEGAHFPAAYFEIFRAPPELEKQFYALISRRIEWIMCSLGLASPREDVFARFIDSHGETLISNEALEPGPIMREAKKMAKAKKA